MVCQLLIYRLEVGGDRGDRGGNLIITNTYNRVSEKMRGDLETWRLGE